jgi:hypothetical protein
LSDAGRPQDSTPLAADDMIGSLATRVRELSLRVAQMQGELEAAHRRIAVYEDFDAQVQDSLSTALRAANQIRERARVSAEAIAEEARSQRPASAAEMDALRIERDALHRAIEEASSRSPSRTPAPMVATFPMSEMRTAATEALRGVFKELVDEIRATSPPAAPMQQVVPAHAVPMPQPAPSPASQVPRSIPDVPAAQQPASAPPPPAPAAATPAPAPQPTFAPPAPAPQPSWVAPSRPTVVPQPERSALVEDVDVAPAAAPMAQPAAASQAAPAPAAVPAPQPAPQWSPPAVEPVGEVQVVLSPISSFPRLVELERRLQGMPVVRTVYARDFRNGVATLAIGLRHPMTVDEFADAVTKLDYPRLRIVSTSGYVLELRIDSEASSIA